MYCLLPFLSDFMHVFVTGHTHWVLSIAWSPDGKKLASGCKNSQVCWTVLLLHIDCFLIMAIDHNGQFLLTMVFVSPRRAHMEWWMKTMQKSGMCTVQKQVTTLGTKKKRLFSSNYTLKKGVDFFFFFFLKKAMWFFSFLRSLSHKLLWQTESWSIWTCGMLCSFFFFCMIVIKRVE